ncbi:MAG: sel1 repeat family protein [Candidatus Methanomethylophilaceae archaeon]|nr:sel1 repeat family protein [Candidatus Methanomethylophilaceae archaeon]
MDRAIVFLRTASDGGFSAARNKLFDALWCKGTKECLKESVAVMEVGSECGDGQSMLRLASCYLRGKGVEKDLDKALLWTRKAAASKTLGVTDRVMSTLKNIGTPEAYKDLADLATVLAGRGSGKAALILSRLSYEGNGVPKDLEKSADLARVAVFKSVPGANLMLFDALWAQGPSKQDDEMLDVLSAEELDGSADALWRKGLATYCGRGTPEDKVRGRELMEQAASQDKKWER